MAGILVAPRLQLQPLILTLLVIDAYAAAVIGRLRSLPMTFLGALSSASPPPMRWATCPSTGFWASTPVQGTLTLSVPTVILFIALLILPMDRIRSGAPLRHVPLAPASFVRSLQGGVLLVVAVVVAVAFMDPGNVIKLGIGLAFGLICLSLVPLTGWGGYVSICQLTFAGLGCYAMYKFGSGGSLLGLVMAAVLAGGVGAVISLPALRLRGSTWPWSPWPSPASWTTSSSPGRPSSASTARCPSTGPTSSASTSAPDKGFTIFLAVVFALFSIAILALRRGPFGRVLVAAKDSEAACATLGLSLTTTKLVVFTLSAAMAGVAGALFGAAEAVAGGTDFEMFESLLILAVVAIGGASVCSGALAGGLAIGFLPGQRPGRLHRRRHRGPGLLPRRRRCPWPTPASTGGGPA